MAKRKISAALVALCCSLISADAATFAETMAEAKESEKPVAIFIHGSSWQPASRAFGKTVWSSPGLISALGKNVILTDLHVSQHLEGDAAKAEEEKNKGWNAGTVSTYPAVQIYGSDGHLLKNFQGRELRSLNTPEAVVAQMKTVLEAAEKRHGLLEEIAKAREAGAVEKEAPLLCQLVELPVNHDPKVVEQLKAVDPDDRAGWQARLSFNNWEFIRHITGLVNAGKTDEAIAETDSILAKNSHKPEQRVLILGAKGKALVAQNRLEEAWDVFQEAHKTDADSPNGKAIRNYGLRVAGYPLRVIVPKDSALFGKDIGDNISRDAATFSLSSSAHDDPSQHPTLFTGAHSPSGYAFHTDQEKDAHIVIDLKSKCEVKALRITNRPSASAERAQSLTLWSSSDGMVWDELWKAEKVEPAWDVLFEKPLKVQFLKLGLNRETPEFFHLKAVDVYGMRP